MSENAEKTNNEEYDVVDDAGSIRSTSSFSTVSSPAMGSTETLAVTEQNVDNDMNELEQKTVALDIGGERSTLPEGAVEYRLKLRHNGKYVMNWTQPSGETNFWAGADFLVHTSLAHTYWLLKNPDGTVSLLIGPYGGSGGALGEFVVPNREDSNNLTASIDSLPVPRCKESKYFLIPQPLDDANYSFIVAFESLATGQFLSGYDKNRIQARAFLKSDWDRFELEPVKPGISLGLFRLVFSPAANRGKSQSEESSTMLFPEFNGAVFKLLRNDDGKTLSFELSQQEELVHFDAEKPQQKRKRMFLAAAFSSPSSAGLILADYWETSAPAKRFFLHHIGDPVEGHFALKSVRFGTYLGSKKFHLERREEGTSIQLIPVGGFK